MSVLGTCTTRGCIDFGAVCDGQIGYTHKLMDSTQFPSFHELADGLYNHILDTMREIESRALGKKIEKFKIGKSHAERRKGRRINYRQSFIKFSVTDVHTWKLGHGVNNRWRNEYLEKGYNALVAMCAVTKDMIPVIMKEIASNAEEYALLLEDAMILKFTRGRSKDPRCMNKRTRATGDKSNSAHYAGVVYLAFKLGDGVPEDINIEDTVPDGISDDSVDRTKLDTSGVDGNHIVSIHPHDQRAISGGGVGNIDASDRNKNINNSCTTLRNVNQLQHQHDSASILEYTNRENVDGYSVEQYNRTKIRKLSVKTEENDADDVEGIHIVSADNCIASGSNMNSTCSIALQNVNENVSAPMSDGIVISDNDSDMDTSKFRPTSTITSPYLLDDVSGSVNGSASLGDISATVSDNGNSTGANCTSDNLADESESENNNTFRPLHLEHLSSTIVDAYDENEFEYGRYKDTVVKKIRKLYIGSLKAILGSSYSFPFNVNDVDLETLKSYFRNSIEKVKILGTTWAAYFRKSYWKYVLGEHARLMQLRLKSAEQLIERIELNRNIDTKRLLEVVELREEELRSYYKAENEKSKGKQRKAFLDGNRKISIDESTRRQLIAEWLIRKDFADHDNM